MKDSHKLVIYFLGVLLLGAILAPLLYALGQWFGELIHSRVLTSSSFQRYFNRALLIAAVLLFWPAFRWLNVRHWTDLGLRPNPKKWSDLCFGFLLAFVSFGLLGLGLVLSGHYPMKPVLPWGKIPSLLLTAGAVSVIEEAFFRGALLGMVRRSSSALGSALFIAALFSILHFMKPPDQAIAAADVTWYSGFQLIPLTFSQFADPTRLMAGFVTLFLVGWILARVTLKTASLALAIGLHGGWVLALEAFKRFTERPGAIPPWFGPDLLTGLGPVLFLVGTALLLEWHLRARQVPAK